MPADRVRPVLSYCPTASSAASGTCGVQLLLTPMTERSTKCLTACFGYVERESGWGVERMDDESTQEGSVGCWMFTLFAQVQSCGEKYTIFVVSMCNEGKIRSLYTYESPMALWGKTAGAGFILACGRKHSKVLSLIFFGFLFEGPHARERTTGNHRPSYLQHTGNRDLSRRFAFNFTFVAVRYTPTPSPSIEQLQ